MKKSFQNSTKIKISEYLNIFFIILTTCFSLFFWNISGINLAGDAYSLGFLNTRLETILPFSALLLLGIFFIEYILLNFNKRQPILRFYFVLALSFLMLNVLFSLHPENAIYYFFLWVISLMMTFISGISIKTKLVWQCFGIGIGLGFYWHYFIDDLVSLPLLGGASVIFLWAGQNFIKKFSDFFYLTIFSTLGIILSQDFNLHLLFIPFLFLNFLYFNKKIKRINAENFILFSGIFLSFLLYLFFALKHIYHPSNIEIFFPQNILNGIGLGEFLHAQQNFSTEILTSEKIIFPNFALSLLWYNQGILGFLFFLVLTLLTISPSCKDWKLKLFLFISLAFFIPDFLFTENGILLTGFIFLPKEEI